MAYKFSRGNRGLGDITFEEDPDTGIDFEADQISLHTSGSTRLIIKEDGKVGIGVSTPSRALDVQGDVVIRGNNILDNSGGNCITFDGQGNTQIDASLVTAGARYVNVTEASSFPFTVGAGHHFINVGGNAVARAINLPTVSANDVGRVLTIFDGQGNAAANSAITINVGDSSSEMIGASTSYAITSAGGVVTILCIDEDGWIVINKVT